MPKNVGIRNDRWNYTIDEECLCGYFPLLLISFGSKFDFWFWCRIFMARWQKIAVSRHLLNFTCWIPQIRKECWTCWFKAKITEISSAITTNTHCNHFALLLFYDGNLWSVRVIAAVFTSVSQTNPEISLFSFTIMLTFQKI